MVVWYLQESRAAIEDVSVMTKSQLMRRNKVGRVRCAVLVDCHGTCAGDYCRMVLPISHGCGAATPAAAQSSVYMVC